MNFTSTTKLAKKNQPKTRLPSTSRPPSSGKNDSFAQRYGA
jgi:hypothetical protein